MRLKNKYPKSKQISKRLQLFFKPQEVERLAMQSGFVQRKSPMTGHKFLQMLLQGMAGQGMTKSLNQLCGIAAQLGVLIKEQSLNERFNDRAVDFFKQLFDLALTIKFEKSELNILKSFSQIILEDSTVFKLPENLSTLYRGYGGTASASALKIDYTYNIKADNFKLQLVDGKQSDMRAGLPDSIPPNSLWLRDLGYYKTDDFKKIDESNAFYLSRLKFDTKVYLSADEDAEALDLVKIKRKLKVNEVKEMEVYMSNQKFKTRIVLQRVPAKVAKKRKIQITKQRKKRGEAPTKRRLELCALSVYITNIKKEEFDGIQLIKLYKIRWQIEIVFKIWKSILKVGQVGKMKVNRFLCSLYVQLIWTVITMKIFQSFKAYFWNESKIEISEIKTYNLFGELQKQLIQAIKINRKIEYEKYIEHLYQVIKKLGKKQYKKGNPNPLFSNHQILA